MNSIENKNFRYLKYDDPFSYIVINNFLDLDYLKIIDGYFDRVPETLYVKESVPQSVMNKLDIYKLKENDELEINCISDFSENNKSIENSEVKKINVKKNPNGQQGINRLFVDINNINLFPEILPLKNKLVSKDFSEFLNKECRKNIFAKNMKKLMIF